MRKRTKVLLLVGCLAAASALILCGIHQQEPHYQGRSLSHWLHIYAKDMFVHHHGEEPPPDEEQIQAAEAVRHIGTNALPLLLTHLAYEPSPLTLKCLQKLADLPQRCVPRVLFRKVLQAEESIVGFEILGPVASPAIPRLATLAKDPIHNRAAERATLALGYIGPQSLPALLDVITNTQGYARYRAITRLGTFGTNATPALPLLLQDLQASDNRVASGAASTLGRLALAPNVVVPELTKCLQSSNPLLRSAAVSSLGKFGSVARPATSQVCQRLADSAEDVREQATNALLKIAPEVLTNTPAQ